eukprot:TRINITY_DN12844_c0_g1_i1.p1 TRINITY_DN12844_c0_g1~~TRINITY_DN12844_c0_g1_i1.p1  ORF type:complete len:102 (+),score=16.75 TRINITY_DN12844_c0_g1_i1:154-459(+)
MSTLVSSRSDGLSSFNNEVVGIDDFRRTTNRIEVSNKVDQALTNNEFITVVSMMRSYRFAVDDYSHRMGQVKVNGKKVFFEILERGNSLSILQPDRILLWM